MSESVTINAWPSAVLHDVRMDGDYPVRCERYRSRPADPTVNWTETSTVYELPLGGVVLDFMDPRYWLVTREGLVKIDYLAAQDALDPAGARRRAISRLLERAAQRMGIHRKLERVQGEHWLRAGVHEYEGPDGPAIIYAERITARRAYARVATPAEAEAIGVRFEVSGERDVTVLWLASRGGHDVDEADIGSAPDTGNPTP